MLSAYCKLVCKLYSQYWPIKLQDFLQLYSKYISSALRPMCCTHPQLSSPVSAFLPQVQMWFSRSHFPSGRYIGCIVPAMHAAFGYVAQVRSWRQIHDWQLFVVFAGCLHFEADHLIVNWQGMLDSSKSVSGCFSSSTSLAMANIASSDCNVGQ